MPVPLLIENTAGGDNAMARRLEAIARLWDAIGQAKGGDTVGFCLDTCHAHAGGNDLGTVVDEVRAITGRIDLVHANDSRDEFDSGADRHTNFGSGHIDGGALAGVIRAAGAPVVCETPGGVQGQAADIAWLRSQVD
jgi:deoxyribonuclease-4